VTDKGRFATHIYSNELLITELFCSDLYKQFTDEEMTIILASIVYEERMSDRFKLGDKRKYFHIVDTLEKNEFAAKKLNFKNIGRMNRLVSSWFEGVHFGELLDYTNIDEGDLIRLFRQIIDLYRQILRATTDHALIEKIENCIRIIQRDVVKVEF
jgi:superfamily II RNA helicase